MMYLTVSLLSDLGRSANRELGEKQAVARSVQNIIAVI